ncbi:nitrilase [Cetobacterium sp. 2A]|uniref:nitrilase-related carbon-nitrogen hydrolase n=1 Tax=Cetobacterium sp. 2A TaxID=2754723 RepID=UPI00163CE2BB|nr:nitrilase-related carbon-nitrogen hydrolase [Cetobacterium sp. 2A]MBC2856103.1 nitrilase [Cetobacterium sp. 2A]
MKVYLAQMKPHLGVVEKNIDEMVKFIERAIEDSAELVLFPELCLTGYLLEDLVYDLASSKIPKELLELSKKVSIIFGGVELSNDFYVYNTAYYLENGELKGKHRKVYLPTYGMFDEGRYFKSGDSIKAFDTKFGKIGMLICEDAWHQSSHQILAQDGANYIFVLTSSPARVVRENLEIAHSWDSILKSSAICNSVYVAMCNRVGVEDGCSFWGGSSVFEPSGKQLLKMNYFSEDMKLVDLKVDAVKRARFSSPVARNEKLDLILREFNRINTTSDN